jgi:hypothetical protein
VITDDVGEVLALVERFVQEAMVAADVDDTGLWEFRTRLRPTRSRRLLCWVEALAMSGELDRAWS